MQKKNNKGSSLVMVIVAMALIMLMVTMILSLTLINYRMKYTNKMAQKNFYTAETALDEIRQGLARDLSEASSDAYLYTMTNYNAIAPEARYNAFCGKIVDAMRPTLSAGSGSAGRYNPDYLAGMITPEHLYDAATGMGAKISCVSSGNGLNIVKDGIILKNVVVSYYGEDDFFSEIQTDIVLSFPSVEFEQKSEMPDLLSYSLVANESLMVTGTNQLDICGNVYMGNQGAVFNNANHITMHSVPDAEYNNTIISGGGISFNNGSKNVSLTDLEIWANSMLVDGSEVDFQGSLFLSNDLVLDNNLYNHITGKIPNTSLTMDGELWAYGNPDVVRDSSSMMGKVSDIENNPADYSSSIIMNGPKTNLDMTALDKMIIGGEAYVGAKKTIVSGEVNPEDAMMGESIAIKANQMSYLVPPSCVGANSLYGGLNPIPASQYNTLIEDMMSEEGITKEQAEARLVSYDLYVDSLGSNLQNLGVRSYHKAFYTVQGYGNMVYIFMEFDDASSAADYANHYYGASNHYEKLQSNLELYMNNILIPSSLENHTGGATDFYCNGAIISYSGEGGAAKVMGSNELNQMVSTDDYLAIMGQSKECRDVYSAMQCKLTRKYYMLTPEEKGQDVYHNLVYNMTSMADTAASLGSGSSNRFASETVADETIGAIVINNAGGSVYKLTASEVNHFTGTDENGNTVSDARLVLVIASGNVEVSTDFNGLILAGGTISFYAGASSKSIAPDPANVALALQMSHANGVKVGDYLVGSEAYIIGGLGGGASEYNAIYYLDLITYENWKKQ